MVYLCEHTEKGALGLVINKPIDITLKNLFEKVELSLDRDDLAEVPVYFGGPVQTERGFVLHEPLGGDGGEGGPYNSSLKIEGGLEMTTSKDVLEAISSGAGPKKVLVTLGYSGWAAGQLEDEMSRNGWINVDAEPGIIFDTPVEPALRQGAVAARHRCRACSARTRGTRERGVLRERLDATALLPRFRFRHPARRRRHRQLADADRDAAHAPSPPRARRARGDRAR